MKKRIKLMVGIIILTTSLAFVFPGCTPTSTGATTAVTEADAEATTAAAKEEGKLNFYFVTHGAPQEPYWAMVIKGMQDAATALGVNATYIAPETFSIEEMIGMLKSTIALKPDGLGVTITDPAAMKDDLTRAKEAGIPTIAIDTNDPAPKEQRVPYMFYIGPDHSTTGQQTAQYMLDTRTIKRALVPVHEPGHVIMDLMVATGFVKVMTDAGVPAEKLDVGLEMGGQVEAMRSYFEANPDTDAVFTLGLTPTLAYLQLAQELNLKDKVLFIGLGLNEAVLNALMDKTMLSAIDEEPYAIGFTGITWLYLYSKYKLWPINDINSTGPAFLTADQAAQLKDAVLAGYR